MRVSFLFSLFREDIVSALFWTLVHSLWQGLALAILTGLVILFTRRSAPVWRYNILLGVLCLFIAGAGTTFFLELRVPVAASDAASGSGAIYYATLPVDTPVASALYAGTGQSWGERLILFFNQRANMIVAIWFIILAIRLMKLLADLWTVQRLRYYRTSAPSAYWSDRVTELAERIGIKRAVRILESSAIKAPMMAGVLKPVILTPLGLLAQLPVQEMEAILLHELAHIRRKDYLTNLLQCFAEVLFFFNPAVLWISSLIREERENCCDDIAVGETNSKKDLINALVSFQEYRHSRYTLAFASGKDHLLRRVRRIVHRDDKTLDVREKIFLLTCLFMMAGLVMAHPRQTPLAVTAPKVETIWQAPPVEVVPVADMVGLEKPVKMEKPAKMQETRRPGEWTMVAAADTSKKPATGKDTAGTEKEREWNRMLDQQRKELEAQQQRLNEEGAKLAAKQRELEMEQAKLNLEYLKANKDTLTLLQQDALHKMRLAEAGAMLDLRNHQNVELLARNQRLLKEAELRTEGLARLRSERLMNNQQLLYRDQERLLHSTEATRRALESRDKVILPILEKLKDKGLVTQLDDVSFSLDNKEFIVNDKKQSQEVFESFRDAFLHSSEDYIKYSKHKGSESTSINRHKD